MLSKGKYNKKQISDYMIGYSNKTLNSNTLPFRINIDEYDKDSLISRMKQ